MATIATSDPSAQTGAAGSNWVTTGFVVSCPSADCLTQCEVPQGSFYRTMCGDTIKCFSCTRDFDLLKVVQHAISEKQENAYHPTVMAAAKTTTFVLRASTDKTRIVKFEEYGIPANSEIIDVSLRPSTITNTAERIQPSFALRSIGRKVDRELVVHAAIKQDGAHTSPGGSLMTWCRVTWIERSEGFDARALLLNSLTALSAGDYRVSLIEAHTAVDAASEPVEEKARILDLGKMEGTRTLHRIAIVTLAAQVAGVPVLSSNVRQQLTELNRQRNLAAHSVRDAITNRNHAARLVVAALCTVEYLENVINQILN